MIRPPPDEPENGRTPTLSPTGKTALKRSGAVARGRGHRENEYTLVFGSKGQGKSTFARAVVRARDAAGGSWVWYDGAGAHGDLGPIARNVRELRALAGAAHHEGRPLRAVLQFGWDADTSGLWRLIYGLGSLLLVLDEAQDVANAQRIHPELEQLVAKGRNRRVDILTTVRTPPELHGSLRGNADAVVSFRQVSAHYAEVLNRQHFHLADGVTRLLELPRFHYLVARNGQVGRGSIPPPWAGR